MGRKRGLREVPVETSVNGPSVTPPEGRWSPATIRGATTLLLLGLLATPATVVSDRYLKDDTPAAPPRISCFDYYQNIVTLVGKGLDRTLLMYHDAELEKRCGPSAGVVKDYLDGGPAPQVVKTSGNPKGTP